MGKCLYYDCYKNKNSETKEQKDCKSKEKDLSYKYNIIHGGIVETLIQDFFSQKFNVFNYGMMNTIASVMQLLKVVNSEMAEEIRVMLDFVLQNAPNFTHL
ncbi:MAG: hypothetical protein O9340_08000 [Cyclobacteriaceae bacterium]|nr:hypothetical protein [Cyclobacteriaceae bacterium]